MYERHEAARRRRSLDALPSWLLLQRREVPANQVFFTDDRPENIAAAIAAGWDAVLYESVSQLNEALRTRGVLINY